jgi:hypothetical protein
MKATVVVDGYGMPPQKRIRGDKSYGILKAARSAPRTRYKSVTRIPIPRKNDDSKEAGHGAERLAIPDSQGIHHRSLLGPSLQQGWAVEAADDQLIWIEGSVEEVARGIDSTVTVPKQQQKEVEQEYFEIPQGTRRYLWRRNPTGHAGRFGRSNVDSVPTGPNVQEVGRF